MFRRNDGTRPRHLVAKIVLTGAIAAVPLVAAVGPAVASPLPGSAVTQVRGPWDHGRPGGDHHRFDHPRWDHRGWDHPGWAPQAPWYPPAPGGFGSS